MNLEGKIEINSLEKNLVDRMDQKRKHSGGGNEHELSSDDELYGFSDKDCLSNEKNNKKAKTNKKLVSSASLEENGGDMNNKNSVGKSCKMFSRSTPKDVILTSNVLTGKRVCKPKGPKGASPPPEGWTATKALQNINKLYLPNSRSPPKKDNIKLNKKYEYCIDRCSVQNGYPFDVQCSECKKDFHNKCVNQDKSLSTNIKKNIFVCKNCQFNKSHDNFVQSKAKTAEKRKISITNFKDKKFDMEKVSYNKVILKTKANIDKADSAAKSMPQSLAVIKGKKYVVIKRPNVTSNKSNVELDSGNQKKIVNDKSKTKKSKDTKPVNIKEVNMSEGADQNSSESSTHTDFFRNVSIGYEVLFNTFQYLTIKELLCCARVCRMWNLISNHKLLWKTVRMKNSRVDNWKGFIDALKNNSTNHLDLRKMIITSQKDGSGNMWDEFCRYIGEVSKLDEIHLCKCPTTVLEHLFSNGNLKTINATCLSGEQDIKFDSLSSSNNLRKLIIRGIDSLHIKDKSILQLQQLTNLVHLSLTSFENITIEDLEFLHYLEKLECFELGDCNKITSEFATVLLPSLKKLSRLRLENGKDNCPTEEILDAISKMPKITHLELINFDLKAYFDKKLATCSNLKKLLLIPTYQQQSATTNHIILNGILKLSSLEQFTWVVTVELIRVTALYVVQYDECSKVIKNKRKASGNSGLAKDNYEECIPVLKPVPGIVLEEDYFDPIPLLQPNNPDVMPQIEILPLEKIRNILHEALPKTIFNIIKVPFINTWKQTMVE